MNNKPNKPSFVPFPSQPEPCYLLPEGRFPARSSGGFYGKDKKTGKFHAVIFFEIENFRKPNIKFMAKAVYWENEIPKLQEHISSWKGAEYLHNSIKNGGIDLDAFKGDLAEIEIIHDNSSPIHKDALRVVNCIYPPNRPAKSDRGTN